MIIKQISVFLENEKGTLLEAVEILAKNSINIAALSLADSDTYGILRMIVSDPDKAFKALKEANMSVRETDVICLVTQDVPGALSEILKYLEEASVDVAYMYGYSSNNLAPMIFKVSDPQKAADVLQKNNVKLVPASEFSIS